MCFQLYAGTSSPLARSSWNRNDPHVHVCDLNESDRWALTIFTKPEVQYVGSTSDCGCDFPYALQNRKGDWPDGMDQAGDADRIAVEKQNREELCRLLSSVDEADAELYGIWSGNEGKEPLIREEIALDKISCENFRFREYGFYRVRLR